VDVPGAERTKMRPQRPDRFASLLVTEGPLAGKRFSVEAELVVGRAGADITIQDPEISRRHASLKPQNGGVEITDLKSANGTVVNGATIDRPTILANGDVITLGHTSMTVELASPTGEVRGASTVYKSGPDKR
jgi:pSer/pThr/pTyr-binding forkhead associated (FHA) protein